MEEKNIQEIRVEDDSIVWKTKERSGKKRDKKWYLIAGLVGLLMFVYAILTSNLIFAIIIIFAAVLIVLSDRAETQSFEVVLSDQGVQMGKEHYAYEQLEDFFIVYRPEENIKNLYLHFKRFARPSLPENEPKGFSWLLWLLNFSRSRLSIPLEDTNPLLIRKNLLKYLKENTERTDIPLSERLSNLFRF
jgi:hypothetical protein